MALTLSIPTADRGHVRFTRTLLPRQGPAHREGNGAADPGGTRMQLGQRLRQLRVTHALTQTDLAQAAGIGRATIARIERGTVAPQLRTLRSIAATLSVEPSELTAGLEELWTHDLDPAAATPRRPIGAPSAGAGQPHPPNAAP